MKNKKNKKNSKRVFDVSGLIESLKVEVEE